MIDEKKQLVLENIKYLDENLRIMREVLEAHENVRERAIKYTYQLIMTIGVIGGFGFTAISFVSEISLFIIGELSLFGAIAVGLYFTKIIFLDESALYKNYIEKIGDVIDKRMNISLDNSIEDINKKMEDAKEKQLKIFKEPIKDVKVDHLLIMFWLFIIGGVLLLFSFVNFCRIFI